MPRPATGDNDDSAAITVVRLAKERSTGKASAGGEHVGEAFPGERTGGGEVEAVGGSGSGGVIKRVGVGIEVGAADDVEVMAKSNGDEIGAAIEMGTWREWRKQGPGGGGRVEEAGADDGGVVGEEGKDVAVGEAEEAAEVDYQARREQRVPRTGGSAEADLVGVRKQRQDQRR